MTRITLGPAVLVLVLSAGEQAIQGQAAAKVSSAGPVAISEGRPSSVLVLEGDGHVHAFDARTGAAGAGVYRVPAGYLATDMAAAPLDGDQILCFTVNARANREYGSFLLQLLPGRREIWTWLPRRGVYVGVAVDAVARLAYVTNSTSNAVYRVALGNAKAMPAEVLHVDEAERIGALAVDPAGRRLFVADIARGRIHVLPLGSTGRRSIVDLPQSEEIRAVAWNPSQRRLYVADAGLESVLVIDPDAPAAPLRIRDKRFREPSGVATTTQGVWLVDEGAKAAFRLDDAASQVGKAVSWTPVP